MTIDTVPQRLEAMAETFRQRNKIYGSNYKQSHGLVFKALFPNGLTLKSDMDFNRFAALNAIVAKLTRYVNNFQQGGHKDSIHDLAVFASMLEELDEIVNSI